MWEEKRPNPLFLVFLDIHVTWQRKLRPLCAFCSFQLQLSSQSCLSSCCFAQSEYSSKAHHFSAAAVILSAVCLQAGLVEIEAIAVLGPLTNAWLSKYSLCMKRGKRHAHLTWKCRAPLLCFRAGWRFWTGHPADEQPASRERFHPSLTLMTCLKTAPHVHVQPLTFRSHELLSIRVVCWLELHHWSSSILCFIFGLQHVNISGDASVFSSHGHTFESVKTCWLKEGPVVHLWLERSFINSFKDKNTGLKSNNKL